MCHIFSLTESFTGNKTIHGLGHGNKVYTIHLECIE